MFPFIESGIPIGFATASFRRGYPEFSLKKFRVHGMI
jgi:hypothetical protein